MIAQIEPTHFWITVGGLALGWAITLFLWLKSRGESEAIRRALRSSGNRPMDALLVEHLESKTQIEAQVADLQRRMSDSEKWMDRAIAYASIVRYDAFENVTGNQSFAIAFQNSKGDGILLNAVSGRDQARIYGKSVEAGQSDNGFTPEEKQAIVRALTRAKS